MTVEDEYFYEIENALKEFNWNVSATAKSLYFSRYRLKKEIQRLGIERPAKKASAK